MRRMVLVAILLAGAVLAAPPNNLTLTNPLTDAGFYDYAANIGGFVIRDKRAYPSLNGNEKSFFTQALARFNEREMT